MTPAQLSVLKADIQLNYATEWANGEVNIIAAAYNAEASPAHVVWRTSISSHEVRGAVDWTEVIGLSQGARDTFRFLMEASINAADPNIRAAFTAIFAPGTTRDALVALAKRNCNVIEKMFATGIGDTASPATLDFEGTISGSDVVAAMGVI